MPRYGYARVSTSDQDLALQRTALTHAGVEHIVEEKLSGSDNDRPKLKELLLRLREGDELVVWKLDRLGRNFQHLHSTVMDLEARGVKFVSLRENIDTKTAMGRLFFILLAAFAEFEREVIRERIIAGLAERKSKGAILGSRLYGFQAGSNEVVKAEADVMSYVAHQVVSGTGLRTIATDLNNQGIPTNRGKRWTATTIRRILTHERTSAPLGPELHLSVLRILSTAGQAGLARAGGRPAAHLLSGFVFCSCGTPMYGAKNQRGAVIYKCKRGQSKYPAACGRMSVVAEPLEKYVVEKAQEHWFTYEEVTEADVSEVNAQIEDLEAKLADLASRVRGGMAMEFAAPLEQGWRDDLAHARRQRDAGLKVVGYQNVRGPHISEWEAWTLAERRELLAALGLRVIVHSAAHAKTFSHERVKVSFSG